MRLKLVLKAKFSGRVSFVDPSFGGSYEGGLLA